MARETRETREESAVSIREIYTLIDSTKKDIMASIIRVENKFDTLESGRLSNLETKVANTEGRLMMIPILVSSAIAIFGLIINLVITKI